MEETILALIHDKLVVIARSEAQLDRDPRLLHVVYLPDQLVVAGIETDHELVAVLL